MKWWSFACFIEQTIGVVFRYIQGDVISRTAIFCFFLVGHLAFSVIVLKRVIKSIIIYLEIKLCFYVFTLCWYTVTSQANWNVCVWGWARLFRSLHKQKQKGVWSWLCLTLSPKKWVSPFPLFPTVRRLWRMAFFKTYFDSYFIVSYTVMCFIHKSLPPPIS